MVTKGKLTVKAHWNIARSNKNNQIENEKDDRD